MLSAFRRFAKSPWAIGLLGLIIVSFAIGSFAVGSSDVFGFGGIGQNVVKVGDRTISQTEFRSAYERYRKGLEQQYRQPIPVELAVEQGLDRQVMEGMASSDAYSELLIKLGLRSPETMVNERIRAEQAFFDPITGAFDQKKFEAVLNENGLTPVAYKRGLSDQLLEAQLDQAIFSGLRAPRAYSTLIGAISLEQRDLAFFVIAPNSLGQIAPPTDAELQAFMKENADRLMRPEFRAISIVRMSRTAMMPGVAIDDAEVQKRFAFEKESLSTAELRTVVQIPAKDGAQAATILARLNKGDAAPVVAGSLGVQPIVFADKPRTAFFDPNIRDAAFKLPAGGASIIKGEFGLAVLKVEAVTPGKEATLAEHRADMEAKVSADAADRKISAASKLYEDAHGAGADMAAAAAKAGLPVVTVQPVTAQGQGQDGKPVAGLSPAVLKSAFDATVGTDSEILQESEGEYYIIRVDRVVAPAMPVLDEIRPLLVRTVTARKIAAAMKTKADGLVARVRKGESFEAVAASAGATIQRVAAMTPVNARQHEAALGRELLGGAFSAKKGEVYTAAGPSLAVAIATVTAIRPGDIQQIAQAANQQQVQFSEQLFKDVRDTQRAYARSTLKAQTNLRNARLAIGVDPVLAGDATGKPAAPAPASKTK